VRRRKLLIGSPWPRYQVLLRTDTYVEE